MAVTYKADVNLPKKIGKYLERPLKNSRLLFELLGVKIDANTQLTFRGEGARAGGGTKWKGFSSKTLKTDRGTWNIRYGTDKRPKRTAEQLKDYKTKNNLWYKPGPMKGYKGIRRYSSRSKLLQASGEFRKSFKVQKISKRRMHYGTKHKLAKKIMSNPRRNVLFVTGKDMNSFRMLTTKWYKMGML